MESIVEHTGGCHCGAVRFTVRASRSLIVWDCNCSRCRQIGNKHFIVPFSAFTLEHGAADKLIEYRFGTRIARHLFCSICGVTSFYHPRSNPDGVAVTVSCVDGGTIESVDIRKFNGINWEESYAATGIEECSKECSKEVRTELSNAFGQPIGPAVPSAPPCVAPSAAMTGRYCSLEPLRADLHARSLHEAWALAPNAAPWTYLFVERPSDAAESFAQVSAAAARVDERHFAVIIGGRAVGSIAFMRIEPVHRVIEIGHVNFTSPLIARTTAATEAVALLLRSAFLAGYRRVEWKCDSLNAPSRRAALRYGFKYEGLFRKAIVYKGRSRDTTWFSMTYDEWPSVRESIDSWLSPQNFDAGGVQKSCLRAGAWREIEPSSSM
jgi:RimJ/RimL family protein N-acetyltransferase